MTAGKTYDERQAMAATKQRAPLTRDVIVDAGLRVVRAEGMAALSMRRLAREIDASTMAAYRHVSGRDQLCSLVLDRIFATRRPQLHAVLRWTITDVIVVLAQYPGAAPLLMAAAHAEQPALQAWMEGLREELQFGHRDGRIRALLTLVIAAAERPDDRELRRVVLGLADALAAVTSQHELVVGVSDAA